jgi:hypothetical protein
MKGLKKDVLFGAIDTGESTSKLELNNIVDAARRLKTTGLIAQLNRLLRENNGSVEAVDYSSNPDFYVILDNLAKSDIHCIYISMRTDQNDSVKATIDCSLFLNDGLLRVTPQWCAYKDARSDEITGGLVEPLFRNNLHDLVYIDHGGNEFEDFPEDIDEASRALFSLSGYPKY